MRHQTNSFKLVVQTATLALVLFASSIILLSFRSEKLYADIWQQLGITKEKGAENIKESFLTGWFHYYGIRNIRDLATGNKAALAQDIMAYAKQTMMSDAFKKQYDQQRMAAKPRLTEMHVRTKEEIRKEKIKETEESIKNAEESMKKPEVAKLLQGMMDVLKNNLKEYKDPNSQTIELLYQGEMMNAEQSKKSFEESMKKWELDYPADYRQLIIKRLEKFMATAATVDFSAELKDVNGRKKFVKPAYEAKNYEWKQIYRAGKDVIDPAVAFAKQWIAELSKPL